jgi:ActR/RegA family two-component response regulator
MNEDRILVVDDDPSWQELLCESIDAVEMPGSRTVRVANSFAEADALLDRQHFHLAFVDLRLREEERELEGKKIVRKIVELDEGTSVVIATGHADVSTAITALKEWKVLDFVLKDAWDAEKVALLVRTGIPAARAASRSRYESAIELLRGGEEILPWIARVLEATAPDARIPRPDRRLGDFLNDLFDGFYPLLREREGRGVSLDAATGVAAARFWSKALGCPIDVRFGRSQAIAREAEGAGKGFAALARSIADEGLGMQGIVCVPAPPPFEAFE